MPASCAFASPPVISKDRLHEAAFRALHKRRDLFQPPIQDVVNQLAHILGSGYARSLDIV
jgi:hypothetical protein